MVFQFTVSESSKGVLSLKLAMKCSGIGLAEVKECINNNSPLFYLDFRDEGVETSVEAWAEKVKRHYVELLEHFNCIVIDYSPSLTDQWESVTPEIMNNLLETIMISYNQPHD